MNQPKIHLGVYGVVVREGKVLMIKKARGPYTGRYDLPGGGIEFGETLIDALRREIFEETGTQVQSEAFLGVNEYQCEYEKEGKPKPFHHIGIYYAVEVAEVNSIKTGADGQDSLGSLFVSEAELNEENVAPIAYPIILNVLSK